MNCCQRNFVYKISRTYSSMVTESKKEKFIKRFSKISQLINQEDDITDASPLSNRFPRGHIKPKEGDSSVLLPLVDIDDKTHLIYTKRSMTMRTHKGQICFPGGRLDPNETWEMAALREAEEEIHLKKHHIDVWTPMRPISNREMTATVTPIVGYIKNPDTLQHLNSVTDEVDVVIAVPIHELLTNHHYTFFRLKVSFTLPYFESRKYKLLYTKYDNYVKPEFYRIWGLTGVITHQFLLNFAPESYKTKVRLPI
uniref:Nudix hydrolase 3 (inferred by orthology to a C. elegans protein) n=1 Tax=Strongyloides venezuelensis TaxID=75913 RepID=A0A0K0FFT9_STRVS